MTTTMRSGGLQHAASLGNLEASSRANTLQSTRSCESEDENMGRKSARPHYSGHFPKTSVYSKGDIREQYCLTDKQLQNSIERPRRERFFGCWSGRTAPQSFLGVCVGRRAPSDENLADYAPIHRYPRYPHSVTGTDELFQYDEDIESSYFRRRPTSFLSGGDPKRYTWMPADEEAVRLEGPRPICPDLDDISRGPYVVGSYPPKFFSQSTEHLAGLYRCPAHIGLPPPPPPPSVPPDGLGGGGPPRQKHVSFARSHTLTSFDEAMGIRPMARLAAARSQERLIGGKKPSITTTGPSMMQQTQTIQPIMQQQHQLLQMQQQQMLQQQQVVQHAQAQAHVQQLAAQKLAQQQQQEIMIVEKVKRAGVMKTQATQTEGCLPRKAPPHHLSLSPRTIHRVKMVSQGAQTNGGLNGRKLTKSLSEVGGGRGTGVGAESTSPIEENKMFDHELLHRTQSEEPPRSPFEMTPPILRSHPIVHHPSDSYSRTSSRLSQIETSRSEPLSSENILTHSRNSSYQSQDSAVSFRSSDISASRASADSLPYENMLPRRSSTITPIDTHSSTKKEIEPSIHRHDGGEFCYAYESHSLPRRACIHHRKEEYHTHSLPRRDIYHHADGHEMPSQPQSHQLETTKLEGILRKERRESVSRDSSVDSSTATFRKTPTFQENHIPLRRASCAVVLPETHSANARRSSVQTHMRQSSEEFCSTCDSESDSKGEKEILIDFKPRISPIPSPRSQRKKKLQKTLSEGEILLESRRKENSILLASASDEDLKTPDEPKDKYIYHDRPIKDEGIFHKQKLLPLPPHDNEKKGLRKSRDKFRKRSISLEETFLDDDDDTLDHTIDRVPLPPLNGIIKSNPPSPSNYDELSVQPRSAFPSTDSLAADLTRDHSDGIWNESQATVLHAEHSPSESGPSLLTPTARRKNLLLQHQQRSSMDTEALDFEDLLLDQLPPPPPPNSSTHIFVVSTGVQTTASAMTQTCSSVLSTATKSIASLQTTTTAIATVISTPHIAVTPSLSIDENTEQEVPIISTITNRRSRALSPSRKKEMRKASVTYQADIEPLVHSRRPSESPDPNSIITTALTDPSSTTTQTAARSGDLDNSKRGGSGSGNSGGSCGQGTKTKPTGTIAPSSSSTQVPVSAQTSQTVTQDGSSFESASSMYSLARGDAIMCEDISQLDEMPLPAIPKPKPNIKVEPSPTHSISSSSSGSYNLTDKARQKASPTARTSLPKLKSALQKKKKSESITDDDHEADDDDEDEKSEKRYSSSGYYESPHEEGETKSTRIRKTTKEWSEDERRRKKGNFKLEFEKNGSKAAPTPSPGSARTTIAFKQISPEDRTAMNILDGTSPSKSGRRFRPKTKRSPRIRSSIASGDDLLPRRGSKTPSIKSPEQQQPPPIIHAMPVVTPQHIPAPVQASPASMKKLSPSKYQKMKSHSPGSSPRKISNLKTKELPPEKRLKALSTESLRSVSPGSDSVFYSEADLISDHQVHCHHCGKEVEIVAATAVCGSQDSIGEIEEERSNNIVQPPAGFADSPDAVRQPTHRLYKKLDKRFRSEERHADRRHYRSRPDTRAKSEERGGKEETTSPAGTLRPAGSSPCVVPPEETSPSAFATRDQQADPEQGIYHGYYRLGVWICITDRDVWRRNDLQAGLEVRFAAEPSPKVRHEISERRGSTDSEKDFRKKYQAITHRLVHRKSCGEMYRRQSTNSFTARALISPTETTETLRHRLEEILRLMFVIWAKEGQANKLITGVANDTDKTIVVRRESGEFGFRIHGSKPVVVSAIEPDTPAESSGLEIGDIVISVNGISVVDKSHSEVVKIAHAGSDTLELEVARTIGILSPNGADNSTPALYSGYLWRQGGQVSGNVSMAKWVRRWFSLRPDHCLYFYKTDSDTQPVGAVLLTNHTVEICPTDIGKPFAFSIEGSESPTLYLAADTDEAANRWVAVMSHAAKQADPWLEVSTRNLRLPPNGVPKPDCFGYLMKLGSKWRAWSKRYCVLKDACLYFYQEGNSKNSFGMACLQGYRVQPTSTAGGRKFAFEVTPPEPKLRHYYFSTETEMDKRRWVAALEYSIDRWMKAG